jgi:hypothetical protein
VYPVFAPGVIEHATDAAYASRLMNGTGMEPAEIVPQAQAIVSEQGECSLDEALGLLENLAKATDDTVDFIAGEVVGGRVWFDPPSL